MTDTGGLWKAVLKGIGYLAAMAVFMVVALPITGDANDGRFLYRDGSRAWTGDMDASGHDLNNVGTVSYADLDVAGTLDFPPDVSLSRTAANTLTMAAGDSFGVSNTGAFNIGSDVVLSRTAANTASLAAGDTFAADTVTAGGAKVVRMANKVVCSLAAMPSGQCDFVTGVAADVQIAQALAALPVTGGLVFVNGGNLATAATITVATDNTELAFAAGTTLVPALAANPVIDVTGTDDVVRGARCNLGGLAITCVRANNATHPIIADTWVYDAAVAAGAVGVRVTGTSNDAYVDRTGCRYADTCIWLDSTDQLGFWITNTFLANWGAYGIRLGGNPAGTARRITISNTINPGASEVGSGPQIALDKVGTTWITGGEFQSNGATTGTIDINMQNGEVTWVQIANAEIIGVANPAIRINRAGAFQLGYLNVVSTHVAATEWHDVEITDGAAIAKMVNFDHVSFTETKAPANTYDRIHVTTGDAPITVESSELYGNSGTVRYGVFTDAANHVELLDNTFSPPSTWGTAQWSNQPLKVRGNINAVAVSEIRDALADVLEVVDEHAHGLWPFVETSATASVADYSGRGHTLTASSNVNAWATGPLTRGAMTYYTFDGTNNSLWAAHHADFEFGNGGADSPFSVIVLANVTDTALSRTLVSVYDTTTGAEDRAFRVTVTTSDALKFELYDESADANPDITTNAAITMGSWQVLIVTYDGGGGATAANGMAAYGQGLPLAVTATNKPAYVAMEAGAALLRIGAIEATDGSAGNRYQGGMSWPVIVPKALSADEAWIVSQRLLALMGL